MAKDKNKRKKKVRTKLATQKQHKQMLHRHLEKKYSEAIQKHIAAQLEQEKNNLKSTNDALDLDSTEIESTDE